PLLKGADAVSGAGLFGYQALALLRVPGGADALAGGVALRAQRVKLVLDATALGVRLDHLAHGGVHVALAQRFAHLLGVLADELCAQHCVSECPIWPPPLSTRAGPPVTAPARPAPAAPARAGRRPNRRRRSRGGRRRWGAGHRRRTARRS